MQTIIKNKLLISVLAVAVMMTAVVLYSVLFPGDSNAYVSTLFVICCTLLLFFLKFEHRKPEVREIIIVAVLSALGVAGRAMFMFIPQFKPVAAIVIIAGVCFGRETGFLVGAVTALASNFYFMQGMWTPWQMLGFGIVGFLAGFLAERNILKLNKIPLAIFGGLATFFIYGGIVNSGYIFMAVQDITPKTVIAAFISAVEFDGIHTASSVIFLFLISGPMIEKLNRIKRKYGIMEK